MSATLSSDSSNRHGPHGGGSLSLLQSSICSGIYWFGLPWRHNIRDSYLISEENGEMATMTMEMMRNKLDQMGLHKAFKPYQETESNTILFKTRKPAAIVDGFFTGSEIDVYDSNTFRVWTNQKKKANAATIKHGLKVRLLDAEAELFVPAGLADELLPLFGAKVKRTQTEAQKTALMAHSFKISRDKEGLQKSNPQK